TLALAAGEFVRIAVPRCRVEADLLQRLSHAPVALALRYALRMDLQPLADDVADRHARAQRAVRVLEDDLHVGAERPHLLKAVLLDRFAEEDDPSLGRDQPHQREAERRLAGAGFADDAERLALAHRDVDAVDRLDVADRAAEEA